MARYTGTITDQNGVYLPGASVLVQSSIDGSKAVLTDDSGGPLLNPLKANALGSFAFNVADGLYDLSYSYFGRIIREYFSVAIGDVSQYFLISNVFDDGLWTEFGPVADDGVWG